jgi:hypothetical protein
MQNNYIVLDQYDPSIISTQIIFLIKWHPL